MKIFISYGRETEVVEFVRWLKGELESVGFDVWLDTQDIAAGGVWREEIGKALKSCDSLIAVITKKYVTSRYCKNELYVAEKETKTIYPLIYDKDWKTVEGSAGVDYVINSLNWTMFPSGSRDSTSLQKLVSGLKGVRDSGGGAAPKPSEIKRLTLGNLKSMKSSSGGKIDVIKRVASRWKEFGLLLEFDDNGETLAAIEKKYVRDPDDCCQEMMRKWVDGEGTKQPVTRELLVELLQDCRLSALAEQVENCQ